METFYGAIAVFAVVGAFAGVITYFGRRGRDKERRLGHAQAEIAALKSQLAASIRAREALVAALDRALRPAPTLDDLARVSREAAGDAALDGPVDVDLP